MVADLQSRIANYEPPERWVPPQSHQDPEESRLTDGAAPHGRSRCSGLRSPGKTSIPLVDRIQKATQAEKSLIERIETVPDDQDGQKYLPTTHTSPRRGRPGSNGKLKVNMHSGSEPHHKIRNLANRQSASHSRESSTHKQRNSPGKYSLSLPPRDDNVIIPNQEGSATIHHTHRSPEDNQTSPSVIPKVSLDHLLPLVQRIADGRMEDSQVGTSAQAAVNSSVITAEVLAQFGEQLINLGKELHHPHEENGPQLLPIEETQAPLGDSLNRHDHHPGVVEGSSSHEPSETGKKEPPRPLHDMRTPPPYREKRRPHSSSELRGTSNDLSQHDYRTERRSWDHYDYPQHSRIRREDSDRRQRRRTAPYSPSQKDRRSSSPTRYHRRGSPLPNPRRLLSPPPERRRHPSEKANHDSIPRSHIDSGSNHIKNPQTHVDDSGSMTLQDLLNNHRGIESSQQGTRTVSDLSVPGLWFAFQGSQELGMSTIEFEFDDQMALNWNIQSNGNNTALEDAESLFNNQAQLEPSLELFCFALNDVQMTLQNLGRDPTSQDLVKALSSLKNTWPLQGNLIVSINAESQNQKFWFPDTVKQKDSIKLDDFIHEGRNLVKFIHLSDLSGNVFVLLATPNGNQNDYTTLDFLLPDIRGGGTSFQTAISKK